MTQRATPIRNVVFDVHIDKIGFEILLSGS